MEVIIIFPFPLSISGIRYGVKKSAKSLVIHVIECKLSAVNN